MESLSRAFHKQTKKKHEETEFHNSIQDWAFTTVYQLQKSAWKYVSPGSGTQPHYEPPDNLHIREVIVTCSKLALDKLIQIQGMDSVSDKILKRYTYIKSSSLWHCQLAK